MRTPFLVSGQTNGRGLLASDALFGGSAMLEAFYGAYRKTVAWAWGLGLLHRRVSRVHLKFVREFVGCGVDTTSN